MSCREINLPSRPRSLLPSPATIAFAWCFVAGRRNGKPLSARAEVRQKRSSNWNRAHLSTARKTRAAVRGATRKWTKSEAGLSIESPCGEHLGRSSMYQRLTYIRASPIGNFGYLENSGKFQFCLSSSSFAHEQHCFAFENRIRMKIYFIYYRVSHASCMFVIYHYFGISFSFFSKYELSHVSKSRETLDRRDRVRVSLCKTDSKSKSTNE